MSRDLKDVRNELDSLDKTILDAFLKRMKLSEDVALYKAENNMPIEDTTRELQIIEDVSAKSGEFGAYSSALFRTMIELSKDYQEHWIRGYNEEQKRQVEEMPGIYGLLGQHRNRAEE